MNDELEKRLNQLKVEDFVWIIYIIIILLSFYSNNLERDYLLNNNEDSKENYRKLNITIFGIAFIIYLYFTIDGYKGLKNLNSNTSREVVELSYLSFIATLAVLLAGGIFLYIAIKDEELNVEIGF